MQKDFITPGFMLVQGNETEELRKLVVEWLRSHPLEPLENEVILVQSNGIAQWLKHSLAANPSSQNPGCGIAAALDMMLPARLQWQAYRAVLGDLPEESLFDKEALQWRLMKLLPKLNAPVYTPLSQFLGDDPDYRKRFQLAGKLADLFDQYQVYRADWLLDWEKHKEEVPDDQRWQPALWRDIVKDMPEVERQNNRAAIHRKFLEKAKNLKPINRPKAWPRRVVVFGISSLPQQMLEVLSAMAACSQVLFCVHNPCKHYWGDIVEGRELFRSAYRRNKDTKKISEIKSDEDLHALAHPLLAAWGKQGRDYIRLLDQHDDRQSYEKLFTEKNLKIDLFSDQKNPETLLNQLQDDILQLRTLNERKDRNEKIKTQDQSIHFHVAHSPQREVEILHDQLLSAFANDPSLKPRDIMVMMPDINAYAPHIEAVFGQIDYGDYRHIPFTIADQGQRNQKPLLQALDNLLRINQSRFAASEILDLLDVPAIRSKFGIEESQLPLLHRWVRDAQIRWGLHGKQRSQFGMPEDIEQNSWLFGLRRILLGYAIGSGEAWQGIEPFDEIGGLESALAGPLYDFIQLLEKTWSVFCENATPEEWGVRLRKLLMNLFDAHTNEDALLLSQLEQRLETWLGLCERVSFSEKLPLTVVREAWLGAIDQPQLSQRFLAGAVNFATLMPMRAIPFKHICLLGMNNSDFPRQQQPADFDLMALRKNYRPGDRSRREDDRYLFLEALLSARQQLYISWVGRSVKDNATRPPSVLVGQLRDHISAGWSIDQQSKDGKQIPSVDRLTVEHPLQPFSRDYFSDKENLFTYAKEWREVHNKSDNIQVEAMANAVAKTAAEKSHVKINLKDLSDFLRTPAEAYFKHVLNITIHDNVSESQDSEPFAFDHLEAWGLRDELLQPLAASIRKSPGLCFDSALQENLDTLKRQGKLPQQIFGELKAESLRSEITTLLERYRHYLEGATLLDAVMIAVNYKNISLTDRVDGIYQNHGSKFRLVLSASDLGAEKKLKYYHLVKQWTAHLALCAAGHEVASVIVHAGEQTVTIPAVIKEEAKKQLDALLDSYLAGMESPLPVACKTAFAWLGNNGSEEKAEEEYEGSFMRSGEVAGSAVLAREWPDFVALQGSGKFTSWAEVLYQPLYTLMNPAKADNASDHQEQSA